MNQPASPTQKMVNLGLLLAAGALFLFVSRLIQLVWNLARLPRMSEWVVGPPELASFVIVVGAALSVRRHKVANRFLNEAAVELTKVTWPNQQETVLSTGISCLLVALCALILLGFDSLWGTILRAVFKV